MPPSRVHRGEREIGAAAPLGFVPLTPLRPALEPVVGASQEEVDFTFEGGQRSGLYAVGHGQVSYKGAGLLPAEVAHLLDLGGGENEIGDDARGPHRRAGVLGMVPGAGLLRRRR